jgi:hypothetical protein
MFMLAKEELAALILSIVIVGAWGMIENFLSLSTFGILCTAEQRLCQGFSPPESFLYSGQIEIAHNSLEILRVKLLTTYASLFMFEFLIGFLSTLSFPIGSPLPAVNIISLSIMPFDGLSLLSNAHTIVVEAVGYLVAAIIAKQWFLTFIKETTQMIFLPLGLVLRAFPFTRSTGSSIIAVAIALYFIYPLSVIFSNYLIFDVYFKEGAVDFVYTQKKVGFWKTDEAPTLEELEKYEKERKEGEKRMKEVMGLFKKHDEDIRGSVVEKSCGTGIFRLVCSIWNFIKNTFEVAKNTLETVGKIAMFMWSFGGDLFDMVITENKLLPTSAAAGLYDFIIDEVVNISQFVVFVVVMSVVEIIITVTMYRNIALMIGGEVEIIGLSKLV